jgi:hypothetical protein
MMAADGATNGTASDRAGLRQALVTSSTKRRIAELFGLPAQLEDEGIYNMTRMAGVDG